MRPLSPFSPPLSMLTPFDRTSTAQTARAATNPAPDYYAEKVGSLRQYRSCVPFSLSLYSSVEGGSLGWGLVVPHER